MVANMARKRAPKRYYTVEEANSMLPLLRSILRDVTALAGSLRERHERLAKVEVPVGAGAYREEIENIAAEFERDQERLGEYIEEIKKLQVELKDPFIGLIDFPCQMDGREVYLCWKMSEPEVAHWHELDKGFAGRQPLPKGM